MSRRVRAVTSKEMRRLDERAATRYGIPVFLLMDHAGRAVAEAVRRLARKRPARILVVCGSGNNGGDGVAAARYLHSWGFRAEVLWIKNPAEWTGSQALHYSMAHKLGVRFHAFAGIPASRRLSYLRRGHILVDALLGTGTHGPLRLPVFDAIVSMNASRKPIVAVDLPSGLDPDTGRPAEAAIRATVTVTLAAAKVGLLKPAAQGYVGRLLVADIGLPLH